MLVGFPPAGGISFQKEFSVSTVFSATYKQKFGDTYIFNFVCVQILQNAQSAPQNPQNPRMYPQKVNMFSRSIPIKSFTFKKW